MDAWWSAAADWLVDVHAMATIVLAGSLIALRSTRQPVRRTAVARWALLVLLCVPAMALGTRSLGAPGAVSGSNGAGGACVCDASGSAAGGRMPSLAKTYAACSGLVAAWLACGALATVRLVGRTAEAPESLRGLLRRVVDDGAARPRLRVGGVSQPVALGLFRPTIVLPAWFVESEPRAHVEAALAHEWSHLRRGDLWALAASRWLFPLFFAHPLFHALRGRLRADQEAVADAEAAALGGEVAYARALVGWARRGARPPFGSSLGLLGRPSLLRKRVAWLLDSGFRVESSCPRGWIVAVRVSAAAMVIGLAVLASTGAARAALSAVAPGRSSVVPHRHAVSNALLCPPDPAAPRSLEDREIAVYCCAAGG